MTINNIKKLVEKQSKRKIIPAVVATTLLCATASAGLYAFHKFKDTKLKEIFAIKLRQKEESEKQLNILKSMADIYYSMHLIDLNTNTAVHYEAKNQVKDVVNSSKGLPADTVMRQVMYATMSDSYLKIGLEFSDVTTLKERLTNKKFLSMDLLGRNVGWIRMLFITIDVDHDGVPERVICTTQIIDEEKRREEKLLKESNTDELTGCLNRRAYEDDILNYPDIPAEENFVYIAMDLNGLKVTNDALGHDVGDELIINAVKCMKRCIGNYGRIYRTGGDEFVAIIFADEKRLEEIKQDFERSQNNINSKNLNSVSISSGYVTKREFPDSTVLEMAKIADSRMYEAKAEYYKNAGIDRRGQSAAYSALCALYTKILKINLTDDTYHIISMNTSEQTKDKGFAEKISDWLRNFGISGQVHPDDLDNYLKKTDIEYLRNYFKEDKTSINIQYRRCYDSIFKEVVMEMITADDYSDDNQNLYLYVKSLDR